MARADVKLLQASFPAIVEHVATAREPWAPVLVEFVRHGIAAAGGRAAGAAALNRRRSKAIRHGICKAIQALPASLPVHQVVAVARRRLARNLAAYGLESMPTDPTIRATVRAERRKTGTGAALTTSTAPYAGSIGTEDTE